MTMVAGALPFGLTRQCEYLAGKSRTDENKTNEPPFPEHYDDEGRTNYLVVANSAYATRAATGLGPAD